MTHRAEQVLEAIASLVRTRVQPSGVHVYTHRRLSLDPEQDELPAISVDYGDLSVDLQDPDEHYYDSTLNVVVTCVAMTPEEFELRKKLMSLALEVQAAINSDPLLGLDFVLDTIFVGWSEPSVDVSGEKPAGGIACTWQAKFRMHFEDAGQTGSVPNL